MGPVGGGRLKSACGFENSKELKDIQEIHSLRNMSDGCSQGLLLNLTIVIQVCHKVPHYGLSLFPRVFWAITC